MNDLRPLLELTDVEKDTRGVRFTPGEIAQQPAMWKATLKEIEHTADELRSFFRRAGVQPDSALTIYLLGAGTSEYVGNSVAGTLRSRMKLSVVSLPTTTFVTAPEEWVSEGREYLFVHFARSGDSPESRASYEHARMLAPRAHHLVITCNRDGALANPAKRDERFHLLALPEATNDRSLVMTSSFSSMALAALALCRLDDLEQFGVEVDSAADAATHVLTAHVAQIEEFASQGGQRLQYLGTASLFGTMQECRLKVLEMSAGRVAANVDTYLGLRHGPQVFVNPECHVVASLSSDANRRRYELDLLGELQEKGQGKATLLICNRREEIPETLRAAVVDLSSEGRPVPGDLRVLTDVVVGQLIGMFKCLDLGLKPDNPSEGGIINRVVSGVRIYPLGLSHGSLA